jgi:hypothetical protein
VAQVPLRATLTLHDPRKAQVRVGVVHRLLDVGEGLLGLTGLD